jgi:hypothetical protein
MKSVKKPIKNLFDRIESKPPKWWLDGGEKMALLIQW